MSLSPINLAKEDELDIWLMLILTLFTICCLSTFMQFDDQTCVGENNRVVAMLNNLTVISHCLCVCLCETDLNARYTICIHLSPTQEEGL